MSGLEHKSEKVEKSKKQSQLSDKAIDVKGRKRGLKLELPSFQYSKIKFAHVPLDRVRTNDLKFDSLLDAVSFIKGHCMFHFGKFNYNLAKNYICNCYVYDPFADIYISQEKIGHKALKAAFMKVDN